MRIDAYTHFFPKRFFDRLNDVAGDYKDIGKRIRSLPALFDLDLRKKIVDGHRDYQQILSYPQPPIEKFAKSGNEIDESCRIINVWADAAVFTAMPATKCGMEFFPIDKIVFASDCPFDPEGGTMFPRETLSILESLKMDKPTSDKILYKNLEAVTGRNLVK